MTTRDGNPEIYRMASTGAGATRLTNDPRTDSGPVWSPDGAEIAWQTDRDSCTCYSYFDVYKMSAVDGSAAVRLTESSRNDYMADW
jgi:Tol biopolymer transport system component